MVVLATANGILNQEQCETYVRDEKLQNWIVELFLPILWVVNIILNV